MKQVINLEYMSIDGTDRYTGYYQEDGRYYQFTVERNMQWVDVISQDFDSYKHLWAC